MANHVLNLILFATSTNDINLIVKKILNILLPILTIIAFGLGIWKTRTIAIGGVLKADTDAIEKKTSNQNIIWVWFFVVIVASSFIISDVVQNQIIDKLINK